MVVVVGPKGSGRSRRGDVTGCHWDRLGRTSKTSGRLWLYPMKEGMNEQGVA